MAKQVKQDFDSFYSELYDLRWPALKAALLEYHEKSQLSIGLVKPYYLDEASILAAQALDVKEGDSVLDLCAAPGGKSLILALAAGKNGQLTVNDLSQQRRFRLRTVLRDHLPHEIFSKIRVTGYDAAKWGLFEQNSYDKVLADVPCSSERHVLNSPSHLEKWSPKRSKTLAIQAFAILAAALAAVKPGGSILYSTCALSALENDAVLEKLHKKRKGLFVMDSPELSIGQRTKYGWHILPDSDKGLGPMYISRLQKLTEKHS